MNNSLHHNVMITQSRLNQAITARVRELGLLPGQPKILECLLPADGCTQKEIALECALDKSTVTALLHKMEADGLVRRQKGEADRRESRIFLTKKGKETAEKTQRIMDEVEETARQGISREEAEAALAVLAKIRRNLEGK